MLKEEAPRLANAIKKVEAAHEQFRHNERWKAVRADVFSLAANDDPATPLATIDTFLREYPDTPHRSDAIALARSLKAELTKRQFALDRQLVDDLIHAESLPNSSPADLIERAHQFLVDHPESPCRPEVQARLEVYAQKLDEQDVERAREYSRRNPKQFAARIERFQEYLQAHQGGGRFISEAIETKDNILREWDAYSYRQAYDHAMAHSDDVAEIARQLRGYLSDQSDGQYAAVARQYVDWWDKISVPGGIA